MKSKHKANHPHTIIVNSHLFEAPDFYFEVIVVYYIGTIDKMSTFLQSLNTSKSVPNSHHTYPAEQLHLHCSSSNWVPTAPILNFNVGEDREKVRRTNEKVEKRGCSEPGRPTRTCHLISLMKTCCQSLKPHLWKCVNWESKSMCVSRFHVKFPLFWYMLT